MLPVKTPSNQALLGLIVLLIVIGSSMMAGGFNMPEQKPYTGPEYTTISGAPEPSTGPNLQLKTFWFTSPVPTIGACTSDNNVCNDVDSGVCCRNYFINCEDGKCLSIGEHGEYPCTAAGYFPGETPPNNIGANKWCNDICGNKKGFTCNAKPVVYLYPKVKTNVNVSVETSGRIIVSDPFYPEGGWKNVEANPGGKLVYRGKNYRELFYESEVREMGEPGNGVIIPTNRLKEELSTLLFKLGLNNEELQEFLDYWLPRLKDLKSNYILFSILSKSIKEVTDKVIITPEPDTKIEFIAYFKPLDFPIFIQPLIIPSRPERLGFTSVEWGGTIDRGGNFKIE